MPRGENRTSILLSREENELVFSLIGPKCQSLATTVVQLFTTEGPAHDEWKKKDTGVLCLIKDNGKRSYFFRIYCLFRKSMIWEHEVYTQIEYKNPRPFLHTFEAEEYMTAFNFANEDEAVILKNILTEKIEFRKQRREERRQRSLLAARANSTSSSHSYESNVRQNGVVTPVPPPTPAPYVPSPPPPRAPTSGYNTLKATNKKPKTRKLTKADIGLPQDFKHVSHVGWTPDKGFDVGNLPEEEMRTFFTQAGVSDVQLEDQATREFIYDFINNHGGMTAVKEALHDSAKPIRGEPQGAPSPAPPVPARSPAIGHPPAPPSRAPPPPPARAVPPPPPPPATLAHRNPPPRPAQPPSTAPPSVPPPPPPVAPASVVAPPPPPPPPPPPVAPLAPPTPPTPSAEIDGGDITDPRAALMESIRSGNRTLRKVDVGAKTPANEDSRSNLLSEIRQGVELRSVTRSTSNPTSERRLSATGLAGALARALQERSRVIQSSESEDGDTTSEDEWE